MKRVKLTEAEKIGRKENRRMVSEEKKQRNVAERLAARAARVIANPGKYKKEKSYWKKDTKAARKAKWDAGYQGRMDRRFMREQKNKLKEVQKASDGLAVHYNMYISFKLIAFFITDSAALKDKNDFRNLFRREYPVYEEKHEVYKGLKNLIH